MVLNHLIHRLLLSLRRRLSNFTSAGLTWFRQQHLRTDGDSPRIDQTPHRTVPMATGLPAPGVLLRARESRLRTCHSRNSNRRPTPTQRRLRLNHSAPLLITLPQRSKPQMRASQHHQAPLVESNCDCRLLRLLRQMETQPRHLRPILARPLLHAQL